MSVTIKAIKEGIPTRAQKRSHETQKEMEILANLDEEVEGLTEEEHIYCKNGGVLRGEVVKWCLVKW